MRIPKVIHQIWLVNKPVHPLMVKWHEDWKRLNPNWEVRLWCEDYNFGCANLSSWSPVFGWQYVHLDPEHYDLLNRAVHLSQRSNIWRYNLIAEYGGIYLDTDVEPLRPLDDSLFGDAPAFVCTRWKTPESKTPESQTPESKTPESKTFECAAFGARPSHPLALALAQGLVIRDPGVSMSMGVDYFSEVTTRHLSGILVLPKNVFVFDYPKPWAVEWGQRAHTEEETRARYPNAYAVHHWSSHWWKPSFESLKK